MTGPIPELPDEVELTGKLAALDALTEAGLGGAAGDLLAMTRARMLEVLTFANQVGAKVNDVVSWAQDVSAAIVALDAARQQLTQQVAQLQQQVNSGGGN